MNQNKLSWRKYTFAAVVVLLLMTSALIYIWFTQEQKSDPASQIIIRQAAAKQLAKDPNDLTDEDFAKITFLGVSTFSSTIGLADIKLLEKFTNLKLLSLENISYAQNSIPKWMSVLSKLGILNLKERFALDLSPIRKLYNTPQKLGA